MTKQAVPSLGGTAFCIDFGRPIPPTTGTILSGVAQAKLEPLQCPELSVLAAGRSNRPSKKTQIVKKLCLMTFGLPIPLPTGKMTPYFPRIASLTKNSSTANPHFPDYYSR